MILEWVSVFLVGLCLGLSVAILVVLWRVWGTTDRIEQAGKERLEIVREQQERLGHLREEREILLEELKRLREQKERLRWLQEGRAGLLAELKRLRSRVEEEEKTRAGVPFPASGACRAAAAGHRGGVPRSGRVGSTENEHERWWRAS